MRLPAAISTAGLTVLAIKASEMGAIVTLLFLVTVVALSVATFSWAARGGELDYTLDGLSR